MALCEMLQWFKISCKMLVGLNNKGREKRNGVGCSAKCPIFLSMGLGFGFRHFVQMCDFAI